jgi:two-component system, chemotaxis family, CheB/CheR fusion protein
VTQPQQDFESLLDYLKRSRGFDFTGYKRGSLERRVTKRMQSVEVANFADYLDYLEVHPEEFAILFNTILINVTGFFRDPLTWDFVAEHVIPDLLARRKPGLPLRAWTAGCASGQEAYTLAMLLAEALGPNGFVDSVKIYATDVDEEALTLARQATYSDREMTDVPPAFVAKYFERSDSRFVVRKDLRRQVIFGRHDLIHDAPISRVDLLTCRNTLMYFNAETQARILARFQYALNDGGVLVLGRAETLMTHPTAFAPLDVNLRISTRLPTPGPTQRDRLLTLVQPASEGFGNSDAELPLRAAALDAVPTPQILVDSAGILAMANERARTFFGLTLADLGTPLKDLKVSYRPVEVRAAIDKVQADGRPVVLRDVEWIFGGESRWFEVHISPLIDPVGTPLGASVAYHDLTVAKRLHGELQHTHRELEAAYEELQSTNEELETTNEELQSTIEELETTNEELQSTNQELETMNEELQGTNEELRTMNDEIRQRSGELDLSNAFLDGIIGSLSGAVIVVDRELSVLVWNEAATELWGLREDETRSKNFFSLDIGLPIELLGQPIRACLNGTDGGAVVSLDAVNRRGRAVTCTVTVTSLAARDRSVLGVILVMEAQQTDSDGNGAGVTPIKGRRNRAVKLEKNG